MRILESDRLILKSIEIQDLDYLLKLRWDKDVMEYLIHQPISSIDQLDWFKSLKKTDLALSIFIKTESSPILIGTTGVYEINQRHQRGIWRIRIDSQYQGKGYAREASSMMLDYAFNTLNLQKIISDSFPENSAVVKLLNSVGSKEEGRLRNHYFHKGKFMDVIQFGLLRDEFIK